MQLQKRALPGVPGSASRSRTAQQPGEVCHRRPWLRITTTFLSVWKIGQGTCPPQWRPAIAQHFSCQKSAPASGSARREPEAKKQPQKTLRLPAFHALIRKRGSRTGRIQESRAPRERSAPPCRCPPAPPDRWRPPCPCRRPHSRRRHSCRRGIPRRRA